MISMSRAVFFEDVSDEVKAAASIIAREIAPSTAATRGQVLDALSSEPALRDLVAAVAERLVRDIAAGRHPVYVTAEDDVSPAEAARILGVSRQFVDRLLSSGRMAFAYKAGSTHRTIRVAAIEQFARDRSRKRTSTEKSIDALLDGGLSY
jgi:excisionase family DNA binding protein